MRLYRDRLYRVCTVTANPERKRASVCALQGASRGRALPPVYEVTLRELCKWSPLARRNATISAPDLQGYKSYRK